MKRKTKKRTPAKEIRRYVIGIGHPWYFFHNTKVASHLGPITVVGLTKEANVFTEWIPIEPKGTGNWQKVRLVVEVLK